MAAPRPDPRGVRIEQRIAIAAPAATIWALIADVDGWSRWNPLYAEASGTLVVGSVLHLTVVLPGIKPQAAASTVRWCEAGVGLHYQSANMAGLVLGNRYVEIVPAADGCTVINGEVMGGALGWLVARAMRAKVGQALAGMNAALKVAAERVGTKP